MNGDTVNNVRHESNLIFRNEEGHVLKTKLISFKQRVITNILQIYIEA
jgi:hypothetical protein